MASSGVLQCQSKEEWDEKYGEEHPDAPLPTQAEPGSGHHAGGQLLLCGVLLFCPLWPIEMAGMVGLEHSSGKFSLSQVPFCYGASQENPPSEQLQIAGQM